MIWQNSHGTKGKELEPIIRLAMCRHCEGWWIHCWLKDVFNRRLLFHPQPLLFVYLQDVALVKQEISRVSGVVFSMHSGKHNSARPWSRNVWILLPSDPLPCCRDGLTGETRHKVWTKLRLCGISLQWARGELFGKWVTSPRHFVEVSGGNGG